MTNFAVISLHSSPLEQPGSGDGGGMNVYVRQLGSALARIGSSVSVYTRATSPHDPAVLEIEPGLLVHHVPAGDLRHLPKEVLPELVDEFTENVIQRIALGRAETPEVVHGNYWLSGIAAHRLKHHYEIPMITTFHTLERVKAQGRTLPDDRVGERQRVAAEDQIASCSDIVLASCDHEADDLRRHLGLESERIQTVGLGVDHALFGHGDKKAARRAARLPEEGSLVLYVGRIQPLKGLYLAVQSFEKVLARHPDSHLVVVGGPSGHLGEEELARCLAFAETRGFASRLILRDPEPHLRLASYYRAADLVVVPSRSESFGLVALEAMACGTAVVAAGVGGLTSLVKQGRTGFLVDERSPEAFAAAMTKVLDGHFPRGKALRAALELSRGYSWRRAAAEVAAIAEGLSARELLECA